MPLTIIFMSFDKSIKATVLKYPLSVQHNKKINNAQRKQLRKEEVNRHRLREKEKFVGVQGLLKVIQTFNNGTLSSFFVTQIILEKTILIDRQQ